MTQGSKLLGAFYTDAAAAEYMAAWAIRSAADTVLEPSFGDGSFLRALGALMERDRIYGVELTAETFGPVVEEGLLLRDRAFLGDFLTTWPTTLTLGHKVTAVVGNPPYVRLRKLPPAQLQNALAVAGAALEKPMQPSGSLWMPFVLHACNFLEPGGRLAFLLPYEVTHVRYARPLWRFLADRFGSLRVVRVHDRIFPGLLQEVVILQADRFGESTAAIRYETYPNLASLTRTEPFTRRTIAVRSVEAGDRSFLRALLPDALLALLESPRIRANTTPVGSLYRFGIGYVCGDKGFFHPDSAGAKEFGLPPEHLRPTLASGKQLKGWGLFTAAIPAEDRSFLYDPPRDPERLRPSDLRYIQRGLAKGVDTRYKCRIRTPWYKVPLLEEPEVILAVFSDRPLIMVNNGSFLASNSLLCGVRTHAAAPDPTTLAGSWYNSLTLLSCELEVHSLGGGVMILIPGEANKILVPRARSLPAPYLESLDTLLKRNGAIDSAYALGDRVLLQDLLGLTEQEVRLIQEGVQTLRYWRTGFAARDRRDLAH